MAPIVYWGIYGLVAGWLVVRRYHHLTDAWLQVAATAAFAACSFLVVQWPAVGSYWLRYPAVVVLGVLAVRALRRPRLSRPPPRRRLLVARAMLVALGTIFGVATVVAVGARSAEAGIDLAFPLSGGTFYVGDAGASRLVNVHHRGGSQSFGVDIEQLDRFGRTRRPGARDLEAWPVFGAAVTSPCDGRVVSTNDGVEDTTPPVVDRAAGGGNSVVLDCGGVRVYLFHFRRGSVAVEAGEQVERGHPLAAVGNSGFSLGPHLHIHAARDSDGSGTFDEAVPMSFDGRVLIRNDWITD